MILQALVQYYEALAKRGDVPRPGWAVAKVSWELVLNKNGEPISLLPLTTQEQRGKKTVTLPQNMTVPEPTKRAVNIASNYLCDSAKYLLGFDSNDNPERINRCFEAAKELHLCHLKEIDSPVAKAIYRFFDTWNPGNAEGHQAFRDIYDEAAKGANIVFSFNGVYAHEDEKIRNEWIESYDTDKQSGKTTMQCLVTGKTLPIARLHNSVKGVRGAQSSGASLVSFNADSFCSFGKEQSYNSPVSEYAAFAYVTALNSLLADPAHVQVVGDMTVIFWAENAQPVYADIFKFSINGNSGKVSDRDLSDLLKALSSGHAVDFEGFRVIPENRFYILGLSPNAARLSVRFFLRNTFGNLMRNLQAHFDRLKIIRPNFSRQEALSVYSLLDATVNKKARNPLPSPLLAGSVLRAILENGRYPESLFTGVMLRARAEMDVPPVRSAVRAAIIKAYLMKNYKDKYKEATTVELNESCAYPPYVLGRLFSVFEALQESANPGINTTIKSKYFNSASATPATILPLLTKLSQSHLRKLDGGSKVYYEKQITSLMNMLVTPYPVRLNLQEQGVFQLGYYHQTQKRYTKKEND